MGTFVVDNNHLIANYTPTSTEMANGSVTLTLTTTDHATNGCSAVSDQMTIYFTPAPTVNAGLDQTVCANNSIVSLNGSYTIASGIQWSSAGTGSFNNTTLTNATYTPSALDKTNGSVKLYLTTTGSGLCNEVVDSMIVTITPAPTINAGIDQSVCSNNANITLSAVATVATGGDWSGGSGSYNPGSGALNTIYSPSAPEIANGSVTLTVTSNGNGSCLAVSDDIIIHFTPAPIVNAGTDQVKCANNGTTLLSGSVSGGASTGTWTNGLGTFVINNNDLNAHYTPTATEISNGSVTLTLTSSNHATNGCSAVSDQMTISFTSAPTANAGIDDDICQNNSTVSLTGGVTIATGGVWSGGTGTFANSTNLITTYTPSATEITNANPITLTLTTTGNGSCNSVSDQITINIDPSPIVNAGANLTSCANNPQVTLQGSIINAGGGVWSGSSGAFSPNNADLFAVFSPSATDISNGSVVLTLTSTGNGNCFAETDQMTLTISSSPIVNAGVDAVYCANNSTINLNGSVLNAGGGSWSGGLGIFGNANSPTTTYQPSQTEINAGFVTLYLTSTGNGACNAVQDGVTFTFTTAPTSSAGIDQSVCANNSDVVLSGAITIASGATWSGGLGTYTPSENSLNTIYHPSAAEIAAHTVTLTLTTTGNGTCNAVSDQISININPSPIVSAGADIHTCYNNATATLNGNIINATGGIWSGGNGVYNPSSTNLSATYTPTVSEISSGQIKLYLTSTGNGSCNEVKDSMLIIIDPAPVVNAGTDQTVCGNNSNAILNGSITLASGGVWSGGLGLFSPNNSILNATYTPSAGDIANGSVTLTLTSTGNGSCIAVQDQVTINYLPSPTVDAGIDFEVCENNNQIDLSGIVTIASGGTWTGGTGIYSPNENTLTTSYFPTATEISNGSITLTLTSTGNGLCNSVNDDIEITINPSPIVSAGQDQNVCVDDMVAHLNGSVSGITNTGIWSSSGTGFFVPNNNTLNADYVCSSADSITGFVTLTLSSSNNGVCLSETDNLIITILPTGIANAGTDQTVCANNSIVSLNGTVTGGATTGVWSTSGNGVFFPNNTTLNATYIPSSLDTSNGSVVLTLTANSCNLVESSVTITITPAPYVNAGLDQTVCVDNLDIQLSGTVTGASNTGLWTSTGTGSFLPNNTTIDAEYQASALDSVNQHVILVLEATGIGTCNPVRDSIEINILPAGVVNAGQDQTLCSNNAIIQLNGSISGGASTGQWATSGSGTFLPSPTSLTATYTPSSTDLATGNVTLVLSATNSCNFVFDALSINFTAAPTSNAGVDQLVCENNSEVLLSGNFTISTGAIWSTNGTGAFNPNNTNMNVTYTPSAGDIVNGNIELYLTTTGNGGCNAVTDTLIVGISSSPNVNAGINQVVCSTAPETQLFGTISGSTTTGIWSTLGTGTFTDNEDLNTAYQFTASDIASGNVQLVLQSTNNGICLAETDTITITFGNTTFAYAGTDKNICADNLTVGINGFVSGGTTTGIWTTSGSGYFTPSATDLNTFYVCSASDSINGTLDLYLTTTNNGGCTAGEDTLTILINKVPIVNAGANIEVCKGIDSVAIGGSSEYSAGILWTTNGSGTFTPNNNSFNIHYLPSSADTINGFVYIYLESTGNTVCSEVKDTTIITFTVPVNANFTNSLACLNNNVIFNDNSSITSGTIINWTWNFGDGTYGNGENTSHSYTSVGNFTVELTVESSLGCSYSIIKQITVYTNPEANFTYSTECFLDEVNFVDASTVTSGSINSWYWDFGNGDTSIAQNPNNIFGNSGTYNVELTVVSSQGCSASLTQQIQVYTKPEANFSYLYNCASSTVTFTDGSSSQGNANNFWSWNFGDGNNSTEQDPEHNYSDFGNQTVIFIVGSSINCADTIEKTIFLNIINANFNFENKCVYDSIHFINNSNLNGDTSVSYTWTFNDGNFSSYENPSHKYLLSGSYNVILAIQSESGCIDSITKLIEVYPKPTAGFEFYADEYIEGNIIEFTDLSTGSDNWQWSFGDGITSTIQRPIHIYNLANEYVVVQAIANIYGCVDTAITNIVINNGDVILPPKLPTAFTPNGDKMNDVFYPRGGPFKTIDFRVYNNWGQEIFSTNNLNEGWDGTYKGVDQQIGVYIWTISATTTDGKEYIKTGDVTLIR